MDNPVDPAAVGVFIPISAIVVWGVQSILKMWTKHEQEMARIRSTRQVALDPMAKSDLEALRHEIASLRDTTTQYDMSVERAFDEIRSRLGTLESKTVGLPIPSNNARYSAPPADDQTEQPRHATLGG